jgi:hypothetical protein
MTPNQFHDKNDKTQLIHRPIDICATSILRLIKGSLSFLSSSKRGKCDVVLHGALAPILQYASAPDEGGTKSSNVGRVLLVAGVGFEPTTFRL